MVEAFVSAIEYYLPEKVLDNDELSRLFPEWTPAQIEKKTGVTTRHIAADHETAVDMAVSAAKKLFSRGKVAPGEIDFVLLCTQSPDYFLPTSACMVQERLSLPTRAGALDINLGCSGFVYGLSLAKGLVETGAAGSILLITSDTYSKTLNPADKSVRTIFGDGAAATLIRGRPAGEDAVPSIGPFVFGTDGSGAETLIVRNGAFRNPIRNQGQEVFLAMDGPSIFSFTLKRVPAAVAELLAKSHVSMDEVDLFVFHQANQFMLEALRKAMGIPQGRFVIDMKDKGNTVSSTIPISLAEASRRGSIEPSHRLMLVGFGVGLSWAAAMLRVPGLL